MRNEVDGKPERTDTPEKRALILTTLKELEKATANEIIDRIFKHDINTGMINNHSWKYYVHLNKLFVFLEKQAFIVHVDTIIGPTKRKEKVWTVK